MASHGVARISRVRTQEQREQDTEKIRKYRDLEDHFRSRVSSKLFNDDTFGLTSRLLRLNPEYYTVWNVRRRCLTSKIHSESVCRTAAPSLTEQPSAQSPAAVAGSGQSSDSCINQSNGEIPGFSEEKLRSELAFTVPLLIEHPKCYWIWKYRMWILDQATAILPTGAARSIWQEELGLVSKMLFRDRRNFHAWGYRRYVVSQLESAALAGQSMAEMEYEYTTTQINQDLSNFSAWHYRSQLIPCLLQERELGDKAREAFLNQELEKVREALNVGPEDQSLWYYHQYLISSLTDDGNGSMIAPGLPAADRKKYLLAEIANIQEIAEDYRDVKWIYEALIECTLAIGRVESRPLQEEERRQIITWFDKLRGLDRMRNGRWNDLKVELGLE